MGGLDLGWMRGWTQKGARLADDGDRRNLHSLTEETV